MSKLKVPKSSFQKLFIGVLFIASILVSILLFKETQFFPIVLKSLIVFIPITIVWSAIVGIIENLIEFKKSRQWNDIASVPLYIVAILFCLFVMIWTIRAIIIN